MAPPREPLAPFDEAVIAAVADERGFDEETVVRLLRRHQETARDNPGVDDLVYEWRTQFHEDPLVEQTEEAYYLAVREHVFAEFGDYLDLSDDELAALRSAHDRQAQNAVDADVGDRDLLILTRE
jgi:hypothetical protein